MENTIAPSDGNLLSMPINEFAALIGGPDKELAERMLKGFRAETRSTPPGNALQSIEAHKRLEDQSSVCLFILYKRLN
jgi:hypothetical protein